MAGQPVVVIEGMANVLRVAKQNRPQTKKDLDKALRELAAPIVNEARTAFARLPGTGPRSSDAVKASFSGGRLTVTLGSSRTPFALGREFGAKGPKKAKPFTRTYKRGPKAGAVETVPARTIDYSKPNLFGSWTGNQFQTGDDSSSGAGRAYYPAIRNGWDALAKAAADAVDAAADRLVQA